MADDPTIRLEPLSVGQILDHAFRLYRGRMLQFIATIAIVQVPVGLLSLTGTTLLYGDMGMLGDRTFSGPTGLGFAAGMGILGLTVLCAFVGYQLAIAALFKSVSAAYLHEDVGIGEAYRFIVGRLPSLLGATLLVSVLVLFGYLLFVVPGVIWHLMFAFTLPVIVLERRSAWDGMQRSRELARGNLGKIFGVFLGVGLVMMIVSSLFELPGQILIQFSQGEHMLPILVFSTMSSVVGSVIAAPVSAAATILLYYDLRIRKEGFDLEMLARTIESSLPPPALPSATQP